MLRLQSDTDYRERRRELIALEEITDDAVALIGKAHAQGGLRPLLTARFEGFGEAVARCLQRHLDAELVLRREALALFEEMQTERAPMLDEPGKGASDLGPDPLPADRSPDRLVTANPARTDASWKDLS